MPGIVLTPAAAEDLSKITDWIAADSLDAALGFYNEVDRALSLLARYPRLGQAVDAVAPGVRRHSLGVYLLFYRPLDNGVELLRVLHGSHDIRDL